MKYLINFTESKKYIKKYENNYSDIESFINSIEKSDPTTFNNYIKSGIDINAKNRTSNTALMLAAYLNKISILIQLIELGADVNLQNNRGLTALIWAAKQNNIQAVDILIAAGADWNKKTVDNEYFLDFLTNINKNYILSRYPNLYKEHLVYKSMDNFNL